MVNYEIRCEGYNSEDDYNIVNDSCYIVYDLIYDRKPIYERYTRDEKYKKFYDIFSEYNEFFDNGYLRSNIHNLKPIQLQNIDILVFEKDRRTNSRRGEKYM